MLKIIISPAKKMNIIDEYPCRLTIPAFQEKARLLHDALLSLSFEELKNLWGCSEKLAFRKVFGNADSLYDYWGDTLYQNLTECKMISSDTKDPESMQIVNLASAEYSRSILPHIKPMDTMVSCIFGEQIDGKIKVKGTLAKMARGEMVRRMAENQIEDIRELQKFHNLNYAFQKDLSSDTEYVFL